MPDPFDIYDIIPSSEKPTALTVTFRRDRADRFLLTATSLRLFPGNLIGSSGFAARAVQNPAYFEAFDAWWYEQDPERPYCERLREFVQRFEAGEFTA